MKSKSIALIMVLALIMSMSLPAARAEDKKAPTEEEMMALYMKYAAPGENHKLLEPLVGDWTVTTKWWHDPGAPAETSSGTSQSKWILGGRFVMEEVAGTAMGMPFHGMGITGYDNYKQQFTNYWIDEMATAIMLSWGIADSSGKLLTFTGSYEDYATGQKDKKFKSVTRIISNDKHVYEMYDLGPDGKEFVNFEITYIRKK